MADAYSRPEPGDVTVVSIADRPDLAQRLWDLEDLWPLFMRHDPIADVYYDRCARLFPDLVFLAVTEDGAGAETMVGRAFAVPFGLRGDELPDDGWDAVVKWGIEDHLDDRPTTHVSALEIAVPPKHRGTGLPPRFIAAMRATATARGAVALVAPVRPTAKHLEPHTPMADYAARTRADGLPADPWLRAHVRVGGRITKVAPRSMTIPGSLEQWREWTGQPFDRSGPTVVPAALAPVLADVDRDVAVYLEPNVWVTHPLGDAPS